MKLFNKLEELVKKYVAKPLVVGGLVATLTFTITNNCQAKYGGGTGEPNAPYRIITPENLNDIGNHEEDWGKHFILVNDVNLAEYTDAQFNIIGTYSTRFTGVFDGNDHQIWNFTWTSISRDLIGLFSCVGSGGQIKNLGMKNLNLNDHTGEVVGALVGENHGTITNCYATGSVSGYDYVGGLVGENHGTIAKCYYTGGVSAVDYVGGLVGLNWNGTIAKCYYTGGVSAVDYVGGLAGVNSDGTITDCYSAGSVGGRDTVGGLVGINGGMITNCYSTGSVTGGGLVGYPYSEESVASFWDVETSGQLTSAGGIGKTTTEMKTIDTFIDAGWDFVEVWGIGEHQTYPYLKFAPAGDLNHDKKVNLVDLAILASHWLEGVE